MEFKQTLKSGINNALSTGSTASGTIKNVQYNTSHVMHVSIIVKQYTWDQYTQYQV
jgi:hypothetical protein